MSIDSAPELFRLDDAAIQEDPFAHYVDLREQAPVLETDLGGRPAWVLSRREDIAAALLNTTAFSSRTVPDGTLLHTDPPDHRALRAMVSGLFTRAAVSSIEPFIARRSAELLDALVDAGTCDVVDDFAGPLTVSVGSRLFGIAVNDVEQLRTWTKASAEYQRALRLGTQAPAGAEDAFRQLFDFAGKLVAEHSSEADTVVARLARLTADGELTRKQSSQFMVLLLVAGHSTTTNLIANSTYLLTESPRYVDTLRDDPSFGEKFIEEVLRYRPSFQRIPRVATRDIEVSGTTIPAGSTVYLLLGSANRDPMTRRRRSVRPGPAPRDAHVLRSRHPHLPGAVVGADGGSHCGAVARGTRGVRHARSGLPARPPVRWHGQRVRLPPPAGAPRPVGGATGRAPAAR